MIEVHVCMHVCVNSFFLFVVFDGEWAFQAQAAAGTFISICFLPFFLFFALFCFGPGLVGGGGWLDGLMVIVADREGIESGLSMPLEGSWAR